MNSQKLSSLILGVFTTAVALSLLSASSTKHQQTNGPSVQPQVADGSGPVPPIPPKTALLADGSGPVPPIPPRTMLLADGSGPVPPIPPKRSLNLLAV
jgi:hypothetical protein